ncbi:hypothetical protein LD39_04655 [Halobacillus sp. BBL2006]|nr:hypothetical protein LD39_04655 [Halobacillus sp. BBL2006]
MVEVDRHIAPNGLVDHAVMKDDLLLMVGCCFYRCSVEFSIQEKIQLELQFLSFIDESEHPIKHNKIINIKMCWI